jgi:hypothetical protein
MKVAQKNTEPLYILGYLMELIMAIIMIIIFSSKSGEFE